MWRPLNHDRLKSTPMGGRTMMLTKPRMESSRAARLGCIPSDVAYGTRYIRGTTNPSIIQVMPKEKTRNRRLLQNRSKAMCRLKDDVKLLIIPSKPPFSLFSLVGFGLFTFLGLRGLSGLMTAPQTQQLSSTAPSTRKLPLQPSSLCK